MAFLIRQEPSAVIPNDFFYFLFRFMKKCLAKLED